MADLPSLKPGAPAHLDHLVEELSESLDLDAPTTAYRVLKRTFAYLIGYFADNAAALARVFAEIPFPEPTPRAAEAEDALKTALDFLTSADAPDLPEVKALVGVFFDGKKARRHSVMMGIGGKPRRGLMQLSKFSESTAVPTRKKCEEEVKRYLPYLESWLSAADQFFEEATVVVQRTEADGSQRVTTRIANQELAAGPRLAPTDCPFCLPEREFETGGLHLVVPRRLPQPLTEHLERLEGADGSVASCLHLRNALEFLLRYFAGVSYRMLGDLGELPEELARLRFDHRSLGDCEALLNASLATLSGMRKNLAARTVVAVFFRAGPEGRLVPRAHAETLQRADSLASWCLIEPGYGAWEDPEVCRQEFSRHLPTLRSWLSALGGYLQHSEHFFEEPKDDGSIGFSVRLGDRTINVKPPEYTLWLNNPRPETAATASGETETRRPLAREPVEAPERCPERLRQVLARLDVWLRAGDPIPACYATGDVLSYLTRYFAAVSVGALRHLGTIPEEIDRLANARESIHDRERLLILCLRSLSRADSDLARSLHGVFFYRDEDSDAERPTGAHARLLQIDGAPQSSAQNLADFCALRGAGVENPAQCKRELDRFLPVVRDWLATASAFFARARHEDGAVTLHDQQLEIGTLFLDPEADQVPELQAPSWEELAIAAEPTPEPRVPLTPDEIAESRPLLKYRIEFIGTRKNSQGQECKAGYLILTNSGGGTLAGTAASTDPSLEVSPNRFRGNKIDLSYWVNDEELPTTHEAFIVLTTPDERRTIASWELKPKEKFLNVPRRSAARLLRSVPIIGVLLFLIAFFPTMHWIDKTLTTQVGTNYLNEDLITDQPEARRAVILAAQVLGWSYLVLPWLVPVIVLRLARRFPPSLRELMVRHARSCMMMVSPLILILVVAPVLRTPLTGDPDFPTLNFARLFPYFFGINLASTIYMELSLTERLHDWFHEAWLRKIIGAVLFVCYLMLVQLAFNSG